VAPLNLLDDDEIDPDIEIIQFAGPGAAKPVPYLPPRSNSLEDFFTLDDSQDESEVSVPVTPKPKQTKKSQEKAKQEEKAQCK